jgi:hypothetical protein
MLSVVDALFGPVAVACALLGLAGVAKVLRPVPTAGALRALRLPGPLNGVRLLGLVEVALGLAAVGTGSRVLVGLVGLAYLCFAAFVVAATRAGTDIQSCGCFGTVDTPPSAVHVVVNLVLAAAALAAAATGLPTLADLLATQQWGGLPFLLLVVVTVYLGFVLLAVLPLALVRRAPVRRASGAVR